MTLLQSKIFKKSGDNFVGINVGNSSVKGLILEDNTVKDYFLEDEKGFFGRIKDIWPSKNINSRKVKLTLKNTACLVRYFPFPKMDKSKLKEALFYEMNKFVPFPSGEVYFDFSILKEINTSEVLMLLAVAKKTFIDKMVASFDKCGLEVGEISLDSISLINLFLGNYKNKEAQNVCILDIGHTFSTMTVMNEKVPFITRDVKFSSKDIFEVISRIKNISLKDVMKWLGSLDSLEDFMEVARDGVSDLGKELKSSFDYLEVNTGARIEKILLSGGLCFIKGISDIFREVLDIDTEVMKVIPENKPVLPEKFFKEDFKKISSIFSSVFGLIT